MGFGPPEAGRLGEPGETQASAPADSREEVEAHAGAMEADYGLAPSGRLYARLLTVWEVGGRVRPRAMERVVVPGRRVLIGGKVRSRPSSGGLAGIRSARWSANVHSGSAVADGGGGRMPGRRVRVTD